MIHGSLFSGIGGFDLAATWAGWQNAFNCEINPFCREVLKYHFPESEQIENIKDYDFTVYRNRIDIISGGFPCQPFSHAGKRLGTDDDRYLWPQMLRAIREVSPRWVVGENVDGLITMQDGMVFEKVCADLEDAGYEVQPYIIPACAVGAPHRRYRVWIVAHALPERRGEGWSASKQPTPQDTTERDNVLGGSERFSKERDIADTTRSTEQRRMERREIRQRLEPTDETRLVADSGCESYKGRLRAQLSYGGLEPTNETRFVADTERNGLEHTINTSASGEIQRETSKRKRVETTEANSRWDRFPETFPSIRRGDDGIPFDVDDLTISFPRWRKESIKAYGNAIVPQVAYQIFKSINEYEKN